ncbi:bifunctional riboflavin kinase/FAD synthetase [Solimicrobium silvestre]|uniref:Riboflavin biosynthesis protein n=1 Tax=Solimicrobium silvestre TaxID=2099400 RepID=A0A2S9H4J4_9BURK|nr:bifunctional riboflavin kinase/FAD synthetase [Solimicrobium silvestre]PRC94863.1 ribF: riboflavin biosynthesis protein RibF [Solimicrobium silvestre]
MKVFRGLSHSIPSNPCALTIGNFDGVHLGHQALLAQVRQAADRLNLTASVMTFEPHPREFFAHRAGDPSKAPSRIANLRDNMNAMANAGMDNIIVEHFNATFASQSPQEFIEKVLVKGLHVKWLMVGEDFCFGAKRAGNIALLKEAGQQLGFSVETLPTVTSGGQRVSSSAVRAALAQGDFAQTHALIGHPYSITGRVVHGQKLGRTIGFPTLNLRIAHQHPAVHGIFTVQVHGLADHPLPAVASIGVRPTVEDAGRVLLETHIFDYDQSCYGKLVQIEFLQKIRDEKKFPDLATMTAAIDADAAQARAYFSTPGLRTISATDRI